MYGGRFRDLSRSENGSRHNIPTSIVICVAGDELDGITLAHDSYVEEWKRLERAKRSPNIGAPKNTRATTMKANAVP